MNCSNTHSSWLVMLLVMACAAIAGCNPLTKAYPDKSLHALSVGEPPTPATTRGSAVLRIEGIRIAKPFDGAAFVYKTGTSQFTTDYYTGFISSPDRILGGELNSWLTQSGMFASVVDGGSAADYQWVLETNVTALYGDYSTTPPNAVIEAKFFLINEAGGNYKIAFQKLYRESEPLAGKNSDQLIEGWNKAYRRVLGALLDDLQKVSSLSVTSAVK